jgi:MoxR-like ATPase
MIIHQLLPGSEGISGMAESERLDGGEAAQGRDVSRLASSDWWVYRGTGQPIHDLKRTDSLPPPPPWRDFDGGPLPESDDPPRDDHDVARRLGSKHSQSAQHTGPAELDMINAALYLRRPLLVTGRPGTGKSTLAYRLAAELQLGRVLRWPITSRTTLNSGLYHYDAIGRIQAASAGFAARGERASPAPELSIGEFLRLGVLGTAFLPRRVPRVLLIDELDKSEADLPNDLLSIFEDGEFRIPELERIRSQIPEATVFTDDPGETAAVVGGRIRCRSFPIVVITSNGEREFPPAFLRRCLQLEMPDPGPEQLAAMIVAHLHDSEDNRRKLGAGLQNELIEQFVRRSASGDDRLPSGKLLDAMYLATSGAYRGDVTWERLVDALWQRLSAVQ